MATQAALVMVCVVLALTAGLTWYRRRLARRILSQKGQAAATRSEDAGRLMVLSLTMALIGGSVLFLSPQIIAPDLIASR